MTAPIKLNDANFAAVVQQSDQPVLIDFWAAWCAPCRQVSPLMEQLSTQFQGAALVGKLNVDDSQQLATQFGIQSIPTVLLLKQGKVVDTLIGAQSLENYQRALETQIAASAMIPGRLPHQR